jgi:hypothetical protein
MVDAIKILRQQAATKRNQAIQQTRAEYGVAAASRRGPDACVERRDGEEKALD